MGWLKVGFGSVRGRRNGYRADISVDLVKLRKGKCGSRSVSMTEPLLGSGSLSYHAPCSSLQQDLFQPIGEGQHTL